MKGVDATRLDDTVAIVGLSKLETAVLKVVYDAAMENLANVVTPQRLSVALSSSTPEQVEAAINALVQAKLLAGAPAVEAHEQSQLFPTPSGFVDYIQHFRPDLEQRVRDAAHAISSGKASTVAELANVTGLRQPVVGEIVRLFAYEGYIEYEPRNGRIAVVGTMLAEIYG